MFFTEDISAVGLILKVSLLLHQLKRLKSLAGLHHTGLCIIRLLANLGGALTFYQVQCRLFILVTVFKMKIVHY